jgi:membrane carboxypeptidase/penicillin-binding protein PbpC
VWNLLERRYGPEVLYSGLTVQTTLDLDLTRQAQTIAQRRLRELADRDGPPPNATGAALVALDPRTGQILAMLGSPDYFSQNAGAVNLALAPRQPGSAIKPLTYAAAFSPEFCGGRGGGERTTDDGRRTTDDRSIRLAVQQTGCPWTAATMILDVRTAFVTKEGFSYVPQNYDRAYHGPVSARAALAGSLNLPAVVVLDHIGVPTLLSLAGRMGLTTLTDAERYDLALTLGGGEVRLLDLTAAFGAFANGGRRVEPVAILSVETAAGEVIEQWRAPAGERVLDERVAYLISDILSDNTARAATFGFNSVLQIGRPAAVKTGTTTDYRDNWTVGYTPDLVAGVWVGNADNTPMVNLSGVSGAGPIWHDFMRTALAGKPEAVFARPEGLVTREVCVPSGLLPSAICPRTRREVFLEGTAPTAEDDLYQVFRLDKRTGGLAGTGTPPEHVAEQVFLVLPPEAREWARQNGVPQPPAEALAVIEAPSARLQIISPDANTVYQISPRLPLESQRIPLRVAAAGTLREVTYYLDDRALETVAAAPFEAWWALAAGTHRLRAEARLATGEVVSSETVEFSVLP